MISNVNFAKKNWNHINNTYTAWSSFGTFHVVLTQSEELTNHTGVRQIEELVNKLSQLPKVKRVRAIAVRFPDIHWIDFELELRKGTELSHEEWEKSQNLVIEYEWKFRDNSGEKWYFHAEPVNEFSQLRDGSRVINFDDRQTQGTKQILSSNLNLIVS